ncbi:hypothetical protein JVU11DRAFT_8416 [Chiua virens]|nr:hypothetical protein JVU11DRAFT_8416 [Chiua virens]
MGTKKDGVADQCQWYDQEGGFICSWCKHVQYCSQVYQHADWKVHRKKCVNISLLSWTQYKLKWSDSLLSIV